MGLGWFGLWPFVRCLRGSRRPERERAPVHWKSIGLDFRLWTSDLGLRLSVRCWKTPPPRHPGAHRRRGPVPGLDADRPRWRRGGPLRGAVVNFFLFPVLAWSLSQRRPDLHVHVLAENVAGMKPHHQRAMEAALGIRDPAQVQLLDAAEWTHLPRRRLFLSTLPPAARRDRVPRRLDGSAGARSPAGPGRSCPPAGRGG